MSENVCDGCFDTIKDAVLQVDSSQVGLGAVLLKDGKPVAYESKSWLQPKSGMLILREKCL